MNAGGEGISDGVKSGDEFNPALKGLMIAVKELISGVNLGG